MTFELAGLNAIYLFAIIFIGITTISIVTLILSHRYFYSFAQILQGTNYVRPFFAINGAVLGFLLAMVLVEAWKTYQGEKENIANEVSNYINLYRTTRGLEPADCVQTKTYVKKIVKATIEDSWVHMEAGNYGSLVPELLNDFQLYLLKLKPTKPEQSDIRKMLLEDLGKVSELRRHRLLKASQALVPEPMWVIIFCCIFISIFTGFFFAIKPITIHVVLTLFQCAMISFILFLMVAFMYPYRGPMRIGPEQFERLLYVTIPAIDKGKHQFN